MCFLYLLLVFHFWGTGDWKDAESQSVNFIHINPYLLTLTDVKHNPRFWGFPQCHQGAPTALLHPLHCEPSWCSPRNPPSSNLTEPAEEAGDALRSIECQVTIPIQSLCFSCSFNCNARNENKIPSPLRSAGNTTTKTRQRFHSVTDISLGILTVLQHQQGSWLTPLALQQIQGAWTYAIGLHLNFQSSSN